MSVAEKAKNDAKRREEAHKAYLEPERQKELQKFEQEMEEYRNRKMEYKVDDDYYKDIFYEVHLCGLYKTYHSDFMHGKRVPKSIIPKDILPLIREMEDFYSDHMRERIEKAEASLERQRDRRSREIKQSRFCLK